MGLDDIKKKVTDALSDEDRTDAHLDKGADAINQRTGGKYADKVDKARDFLDDKVGDERSGGGDEPTRVVGDASAGSATGERTTGDPGTSAGHADAGQGDTGHADTGQTDRERRRPQP